MAIYYLDVDDEITGAVARLRAASDYHVALVLPAGSRVATSRINFRLLAREAQNHQRRLSVVTPETSVRAIAVAAGLPAYATVPAYEQALEDERAARRDQDAFDSGRPQRGGGDAPPAGRAGVAPVVRERAGSAASATPVSEARAATPEPVEAVGGPPVPAVATAGGAAVASVARSGGGDADPGSRRGAPVSGRSAGALPVVRNERREGRPRWHRWAIVLAVIALFAAVGGAGASYVLPTAEITVTPKTVAVGPVAITVTADPAATAVDAANHVVPAKRVTLPLSVEDTFPATGQKVDQKTAGGTVTFTSNDTIDAVPIPAGTAVATSDGVQFVTTAPVTAPKATVSGSTINAGVVDAPIQAVSPGPAGNVAAHAIDVASARLQAFLISVDNADATSGGSRTVTKIVSQDDYDSAVKALTAKLDDALAAAAADPANAPTGQTLFPETARHGKATADPAAGGVVSTAAASFDLTVTASGTVTAVDTSQLGTLAVDPLRAVVPAGDKLFEDSITTTVGDGTPDGDAVQFPVQATGEGYTPLDGSKLLDTVKGKSVAQARSMLAQYGDVKITTWPGYVDTIPTLEGRASLTVAPPRRQGP